MFEFHPTGASGFYDSGRFARDGVVCVTINYRVGAEGVLYLGDGVSNLGLLDQIAALEWVQENIGAFGGDAGKVTVFGQSAGAMSVAMLLSMPLATGLFHRAIVESGTAHSVNSPATAARIGRRIAEKLGAPATREAIAAISSERLLQAQVQLRDELLARPDPAFWGEVALSYLPWALTAGGETIPECPIDRILAGAAADIDLLVGSNTEETRLFFLSDGSIDRITDDAVVAMALRSAGGSPERVPRGASGGQRRRPVLGYTDRLVPAHPRYSLGRRSRDERPRLHLRIRVRLAPQFGGRLGAAHGVEIPFVFDTLGLGTEPLLGRDPPQSLADVMHGAWVAFAAGGLWLAEIRSRRQADHALKHGVANRGRSSGRGARSLEGRALATPAPGASRGRGPMRMVVFRTTGSNGSTPADGNSRPRLCKNSDERHFRGPLIPPEVEIVEYRAI